MNNTQISNSFHFNTFRREKYSYTDNRRGSPDHYIAYMRSGHCRIVTETYTVEIQEGDVFYIPYGIPYQSYWYGHDLICFDSYAFRFFPEAAQDWTVATYLANVTGWILMKLPGGGTL